MDLSNSNRQRVPALTSFMDGTFCENEDPLVILRLTDQFADFALRFLQTVTILQINPG